MKPASVAVELSLMLMPPTPPWAQVEFSKNQIVVVLSAMGTSYVVCDVPLFAGRGPVLKPLSVALWSCAGTHGASNVLWMRSYVPFVTAGATHGQVSKCAPGQTRTRWDDSA